MVQDFGFGALGDAHEVREFLVPESGVPFGNVSRSRSRRVAELITEPVLAAEIGRTEEQINAQLQLVSELPRNDFTKVLESHAARSCNRPAALIFGESLGNLLARRFQIAQTAKSNAK